MLDIFKFMFFVSILLLTSCQSGKQAKGKTASSQDVTAEKNIKNNNNSSVLNLRGATPAFLLECENVDLFSQKKCTTDALTDMIRDELKYPEKAKSEDRKGFVQIRAVIDENGQMNELAFFKKMNPANDDLNQEAMRVAEVIKSKNLNWKPSVFEGKAVKNSFVFPQFRFPMKKKLTPEMQKALDDMNRATRNIGN